MLERWQDLLERNSLKASLEISLTGISNEEIVRALSESLEEISEPLQEYLDAAEHANDRTATFRNERYAANFDILIDLDSVSTSIATPADERLKIALREFGSICVKVSKDEDIDAIQVESFVQSLSRYSSVSGNPVGLGLLIGHNIKPETHRAATSVNMRRIRNIMIIEKSAIANLH